MIRYQKLTADDMAGIRRLYEQMGWTAYLTDNDRLFRAWERSLFTLGAFDGEELIGFVRCLGDGEHTVLIQDLIVAKAYHRRGIGKALTEAVFRKYADVRQIFVVTDIGSPAAFFYRALGMQPFEEAGLLALCTAPDRRPPVM